MPRTMGTLAFPDFRGWTRALVLWNLGVFFLLLVLGAVAPQLANLLLSYFGLQPALVLHGWVWQLLTYSFLHVGLLNTFFELLSLWFLGSFLEQNHGSRWLAELYFVSVAGAGLAAVLLALVMDPALRGGFAFVGSAPLTGAFGGIFGLLIAFAVLFGDLQFTLFPIPIAIKAKYLAAVYMLIAVAQLFGASRSYALGQLGGALAGYLYIRFAPRGYRQASFRRGGSEWWFGLRNRYTEWKRRQAAQKFQVYMRKQNRDVHVPPESDEARRRQNPNDRSWMN
jgi:membrane associated rhomboid family serine protease